ncbi:MAG: EamA family transporter [Bacteroidota bacterium]
MLITYVGLFIAFVGEARFQDSPDFYLGSTLILICAVTYAIYIAGSGAMIPVVGAIKFNSYAMSFAAAAVLTHFMVTSTQSVIGLPFVIYVYGFVMAIVSTVIPSYLVSISIKRLGANTTAIIASIGPVSTILQASLLLGESFRCSKLPAQDLFYWDFGNQLEEEQRLGETHRYIEHIGHIIMKLLFFALVLFASEAVAQEKYTFMFLHHRTDLAPLPKEESDKLMEGHMANIQKMANDGNLIAAGPLEGGGGIFIFKPSTPKEVEEWVRSRSRDSSEALEPRNLKI